MNHRLLFASAILLVAASLAGAQAGREYRDPAGKFAMSVFGDWKDVSFSDAVGRQKTEFVYRDRSEGLLKISREALNGRPLQAAVHEEEESLRLYRGGFELLGTEPFKSIDGQTAYRFAFNYIEGSRKLTGTYYFIQDKNYVWLLRFTGKRGTVDAIRNMTDQMARSFRAQ